MQAPKSKASIRVSFGLKPLETYPAGKPHELLAFHQCRHPHQTVGACHQMVSFVLVDLKLISVFRPALDGSGWSCLNSRRLTRRSVSWQGSCECWQWRLADMAATSVQPPVRSLQKSGHFHSGYVSCCTISSCSGAVTGQSTQNNLGLRHLLKAVESIRTGSYPNLLLNSSLFSFVIENTFSTKEKWDKQKPASGLWRFWAYRRRAYCENLQVLPCLPAGLINPDRGLHLRTRQDQLGSSHCAQGSLTLTLISSWHRQVLWPLANVAAVNDDRLCPLQKKQRPQLCIPDGKVVLKGRTAGLLVFRRLQHLELRHAKVCEPPTAAYASPVAEGPLLWTRWQWHHHTACPAAHASSQSPAPGVYLGGQKRVCVASFDGLSSHASSPHAALHPHCHFWSCWNPHGSFCAEHLQGLAHFSCSLLFFFFSFFFCAFFSKPSCTRCTSTALAEVLSSAFFFFFFFFFFLSSKLARSCSNRLSFCKGSSNSSASIAFRGEGLVAPCAFWTLLTHTPLRILRPAPGRNVRSVSFAYGAWHWSAQHLCPCYPRSQSPDPCCVAWGTSPQETGRVLPSSSKLSENHHLDVPLVPLALHLVLWEVLCPTSLLSILSLCCPRQPQSQRQASEYVPPHFRRLCVDRSSSSYGTRGDTALSRLLKWSSAGNIHLKLPHTPVLGNLRPCPPATGSRYGQQHSPEVVLGHPGTQKGRGHLHHAIDFGSCRPCIVSTLSTQYPQPSLGRVREITPWT